jgi:hypothetical protein
MSTMALMACRGFGLIAAVSLSLCASGSGWAGQGEPKILRDLMPERAINLAQMCKHKDFETCIRDECGAPITPTPAAPGKPYQPTAAENQQQACYKVHAEPCRAANNCPH